MARLPRRLSAAILIFAIVSTACPDWAAAAPHVIDPPILSQIGDALHFGAKIVELGSSAVTVVLVVDRETTCFGNHPRRKKWTRVTRRLDDVKPEGGRVAISLMFEALPNPCPSGDRRGTRFTMAQIKVLRGGNEILQRTYAPMGGHFGIPRR